jgi:hypothetical protein
MNIVINNVSVACAVATNISVINFCTKASTPPSGRDPTNFHKQKIIFQDLMLIR